MSLPPFKVEQENNTEPPSKIKNIAAWFFGVLFLIMSLGAIRKERLSAICFLIAGCLLVPPLCKMLSKLFTFSKGLKTALIALAVIVGVANLTKPEKAPQTSAMPSQEANKKTSMLRGLLDGNLTQNPSKTKSVESGAKSGALGQVENAGHLKGIVTNIGYNNVPWGTEKKTFNRNTRRPASNRCRNFEPTTQGNSQRWNSHSQVFDTIGSAGVKRHQALTIIADTFGKSSFIVERWFDRDISARLFDIIPTETGCAIFFRDKYVSQINWLDEELSEADMLREFAGKFGTPTQNEQISRGRYSHFNFYEFSPAGSHVYLIYDTDRVITAYLSSEMGGKIHSEVEQFIKETREQASIQDELGRKQNTKRKLKNL